MTKEFNPQEDNKNPDALINFLISLKKLFTRDKPVSDDQIEAHRKDYWKCSTCEAINDMDMDFCWDCDYSRPTIVEYPGKEEIRKELQEKNKLPRIWIGLVFIIFSGIVLFIGYIYDSRKHEWPDLITIVGAGILAIPGIALIIYGLIRKVFRK